MQTEKYNNIVKIRILELEDKLMGLIKISSNYGDIPVPVFEIEMNTIIKEIEYLKKIVK